MKWSELPLSPTPKALRQFAAAWLVFFLLGGLHQYLMRGRPQVGLIMAGLAVVVGVLGLVKPMAVRWLFIVAMVAAFPIGWVVSQLMLLLMFFAVITPVALFFRLMGRDALQRKPAPDRPSLWVPKATPSDVRRYFKQY